MKLRITFRKTSKPAIIEVRISVEEMGDYKSRYIFHDVSDFPSSEGWEIGNKEFSYITHTLHVRDAQQWVNTQVQVIREKLNEWRSYAVPEDYYIEI